MKKTRVERISDILLFLLKPLVHVWMFFDSKRKVRTDGKFNLKRKDAYIILANHTFKFDVVHVPLRLRRTPYIIASETLHTKFGLRFLLKYVAKTIPKSKGTNDIRTLRNILAVIKRGYPILIFPEGDTTFYGKTNYIEYSTAKLVKKLGVDLVVCNVTGGYLSNPRWALTKRGNRRIELNYKISITKEELQDMSVDQIYEIMKKDLHVNAYEIQRKQMIPHPGKNLALGIDNILYVCPKCHSYHTIESSDNLIRCNNCHTEGKINEYGFIEGFKFDNLVDWDDFQRNYVDGLKDTEFNTDAVLYFTDNVKQSRRKIGEVLVEYRSGKLTLKGVINQVIDVDKIINPIITLRSNLSFEFEKKRYFLKLRSRSAAFIRTLQRKY